MPCSQWPDQQWSIRLLSLHSSTWLHPPQQWKCWVSDSRPHKLTWLVFQPGLTKWYSSSGTNSISTLIFLVQLILGIPVEGAMEVYTAFPTQLRKLSFSCFLNYTNKSLAHSSLFGISFTSNPATLEAESDRLLLIKQSLAQQGLFSETLSQKENENFLTLLLASLKRRELILRRVKALRWEREWLGRSTKWLRIMTCWWHPDKRGMEDTSRHCTV